MKPFLQKLTRTFRRGHQPKTASLSQKSKTWGRCRLVIGFGSALVMAMSATLAAPPRTGVQGQAFFYISLGIPVEIEPGVWVGIPDVQMPVSTSFTIVAAPSGRSLG